MLVHLMLRLALLLVFFTTMLSAIQPVLVQPESVGMSSERLERIGEWLDGIIDRKEAAGFVTIVARNGQVVHHEARGTRGLSVSGPMPLDALFDIASMTKPITVAAALTLLEEGRFTLADPISEYLPAFRNPKVQLEGEPLKPADREITVRHLFTHTSGVSDPRSRAETFAFPTLEAYMADFAKLPLRAQPGSEWLYGDSHDVLGYLVQEVSGQPLDQFVNERILKPLGMSDTHYWPPKSKDSRRAILVVDGKDDLDSTSRRPIAAAEAGTFIGGASGIYTTAADYWRFCQMLLNGGEFEGQRLLGPKTVSWINQDHLDSNVTFRPGQRFGLGFAILTDPGKADWFYSEGSYFWGGSQGTVFWIDPAEELTAVLMVQVTPSSKLRLREKFAALVYASIVD
jgi:CubicO group peptidase (beta-lactamase class C family)